MDLQRMTIKTDNFYVEKWNYVVYNVFIDSIRQEVRMKKPTIGSGVTFKYSKGDGTESVRSGFVVSNPTVNMTLLEISAESDSVIDEQVSKIIQERINSDYKAYTTAMMNIAKEYGLSYKYFGELGIFDMKAGV